MFSADSSCRKREYEAINPSMLWQWRANLCSSSDKKRPQSRTAAVFSSVESPPELRNFSTKDTHVKDQHMHETSALLPEAWRMASNISSSHAALHFSTKWGSAAK
jgi:hypothetical protein